MSKNKSINGCIGRSDGIYNKKLTPLSDGERVVLKMIDNGITRIVDGNLYIPESSEMNSRLGKYEVVSISDKAKNEYGLEVGDVILADRLAVYYDTNPICIMDYQNIICKIVDDKPYPLKNMVFVKYMKPKEKSSGGIIYADISNSDLPIGKVFLSSTDDIKTDAIIPLSEGADKVTVRGENFSIFKYEMIIATVELTDEELENYEKCEVKFESSK